MVLVVKLAICATCDPRCKMVREGSVEFVCLKCMSCAIGVACEHCALIAVTGAFAKWQLR